MTFVQNASFGHESLSNDIEMVSKGHDSCQTAFKPVKVYKRMAPERQRFRSEYKQKMISGKGMNCIKPHAKQIRNLYMNKGHEDD